MGDSWANLYWINITNLIMIRAIVTLSVICAAAVAMTTTTSGPPMTTTMDQATTTMMNAKVLYDMKHHKAMIVKDDGCYEYAMNHQDVMDAQNDATRATLEARTLSELATAINVQESGHHHIDHMSQEIKSACASLPVYQWEVAQG